MKMLTTWDLQLKIEKILYTYVYDHVFKENDKEKTTTKTILIVI